MSTSVAQIFSALAFDSSTRLYRLDAAGDLADLLVESWACRESLNEPWELELNTLGTNCDLDIHAMLGQKVTLRTVLADGSLHSRTGIITAAAIEDADGGFARYILTVRPWIALLAHTRQSRVWVEKPFTELIESVFTRYAANAQWRWADDISEHLARSPFSSTNTPSAHRSYTVQYRETDLDFLSRLLAEEGLVWRVEANPPVTDYREFTARQTGLYRITQILPDALAAQAASACCDAKFCLRRRLWTVPGLEPDAAAAKSALLCLEPCALLLDLARRAMKLEQEPKGDFALAESDVPVLVAALETALVHPQPGVREGDSMAAANPRRFQLLLEKLRPLMPANQASEE